MAEQGSSLLKVLVLARLLVAEDFGLMGIALFAFGILETFSESGFRSALVRHPEAIEGYIDTAWVVGIVRGLGLSLALMAAASFVARFFGEPAALPIMYALAVVPVIRGIGNPAVVQLLRNLDFRRQLWFQLSGVIPSLLTAVALGLWLRNVWALVGAVVADEIGRCIASYWLATRWPRFRFDWAKARELALFGRWILVSGIVVFLILQGDRIVVARLLGTVALGYYSLGVRLAMTPTVEVSYLLSTVCLPTYAQIQSDVARLRVAFFRVVTLTAVVVVPAATALWLFSREIVAIVLGSRWAAAAVVVGPLAFAGAARAVLATAGPLFSAAGRPALDARMNAFRLAGLIVAGPFLVLRWELWGAGVAVLIATLFAMPGWVVGIRQVLPATREDFWTALRPAVIATGAMVAMGLAGQVALRLIEAGPAIISLVILGAVLPSAWIAVEVFLSTMGWIVESRGLRRSAIGWWTGQRWDLPVSGSKGRG